MKKKLNPLSRVSQDPTNFGLGLLPRSFFLPLKTLIQNSFENPEKLLFSPIQTSGLQTRSQVDLKRATRAMVLSQPGRIETHLQPICYALLVLFLGACASTRPDSQEAPIVEGSYRITEDRSALDEVRKSIPTEVKEENDEKALDLRLLQDSNLKIDEKKSRFDSALRKKREAFNKNMNRTRETFTKNERRKKETFLKELAADRKNFQSQRRDKEERSQFFRDQDEKRRNFFADERDLRNQFESDVRTQRKDFDDYVKSRQNSFYQEWRALKKSEEAAKSTKGSSSTRSQPALPSGFSQNPQETDSSGLFDPPGTTTPADNSERENE